MPRNIRIQARVTQSELDAINAYGKTLGLSMSKMVVEGVQLYIDVLRKERQGLRMVFVDANGYALPAYNQNFTGVVKWQTSPSTSATPPSSQATPALTLMR